MIAYKGVEIEDGLRPFIRHMDSVEEYREMLQSLQSVWDNLTLLGQLSGTGTDMSDTRKAFSALTASLINNLAVETRRKVVLEMTSKAQVAVDIMVRNLFERTADIGFLATDDDIRAFGGFAAEHGENALQREEMRNRRQALVERFREYVRKYSVYRNIIFLDPKGKVLAQLDGDNAVESSSDALIRESLTTSAAYVETFRKSDLEPDQPVSLIYSYRVTTADGTTPLGVLCLCFRFENETARIFADLKSPGDWSTIALLDAQGRVIASSDAYHLPVGAPLESVLDQDCRVVQFAGREYLATTRATHGYQGYMGPGWSGHVMVPIDKAFARDDNHRLAQVEDRVLTSVMSSPTLFSAGLRRIPEQAEKIQRELNRSVWNGNVRQSSDRRAVNPAFSKILLWEIGNTGLKTQDVFERSIGNLHETVVSSILGDSEFLASLAINIMDRNLYERSDDCRWWAQTTAFREALAGGDEGSGEQIAAILAYINGLYTVYTNLMVFDAAGNVVAVSNPEFRECVGKPVGEEWVRRTLALKTTQDYAVSQFEPTPLYQGHSTYIYAAAIRAPGDAERVVGGIGIVFDSTPQFSAMLHDALPRDEHGEVSPGCFGVFVDGSRRVIAASSEQVRVGDVLPVDEAFVSAKAAHGFSSIVEHDGRYYAVGSKMSSGYREYKGPDDAYRNELAALVFIPLGPVTAAGTGYSGRRESMRLPHRVQGRANGTTTEIATFYIGEEWFGIPSAQVVEAIEASDITPLPGMPAYVTGVVMYSGNPILIFDLKDHLHFGKPVNPLEYRQIVVVRDGEDEHFGVLVHRLGEIPEVANDRIEAVDNLFPGEHVLADCLVKPDVSDPAGGILVTLSTKRIRHKLIEVQSRLSGTAQLQSIVREEARKKISIG